VLFIDEPTSGLSSRDSENIMDLLKELTLRGKLIFTVIHQPSSDIFKMLDKLFILDQGGYPIYYGNPVESIIYFKRLANQANLNESECPSCGNVNPEQIFNIIEAKVLDEYGHETEHRKVTPAEWNNFFNVMMNRLFFVALFSSTSANAHPMIQSWQNRTGSAPGFSLNPKISYFNSSQNFDNTSIIIPNLNNASVSRTYFDVNASYGFNENMFIFGRLSAIYTNFNGAGLNMPS
jgi:hypothetical protein